jgi:TolB-like protein
VKKEYLADGLTDEVIACLGQIDPLHLQVIGRTSVMSYKRTSKSLTEIGRELGAAFLVESSKNVGWGETTACAWRPAAGKAAP